MKFYPTPAIILGICAISLSACNKPVVEHHHEHQEIVVTSPEDKSVTLTEQYVCQIHSRRHIEVRALEGGYLEKIPVAEGQVVKQGDSMFKIVPTLYQARLDSAAAEAKLARVEYDNTKRLFEQNVVSDKEVMLAEAKLAKARAAVQLAEARLNFTDVKAPFDGIIDRLHEQQGSLIEEGDILTTLSDNDVMWVYFNVPEARYLEYKAGLHQVVQTTNPAAQAEADVDGGDPNELEIELVLANGNKFGEHGEITAVEADFNNETGNIAFRADFPNPNALLRHGQTGTVLIHRQLKDALVIPQRATFEILDKRYVYVIDKDDVARQREIVVDHEMEDIFVIKQGLKEEDKIVLEGVSQVRDGDKIDYEFRGPNLVFNNLKNVAE